MKDTSNLTKNQYINETIKLINDLFVIQNEDDESVISEWLDSFYSFARERGYEHGYCDGLGEGCDYNGRKYDEVAYEWDEENDEPGKKIDYKWDLK